MATTVDLGGGGRRHLQLARGVQWLQAARGDSFAAFLCGHEPDHELLTARLRHDGPIWRSSTGTWVVTRYRTAEAVLVDPVFEAHFTAWRPMGIPALPSTESDLGLEPERQALLSGLAAARTGQDALARRRLELTAACERALDAAEDHTDLAVTVAGLVLDMLMAALDLSGSARGWLADRLPYAGLAADGQLCSQGAEPTSRMLGALAQLRQHFRGQPGILAILALGHRITTDLVLGALAEMLTVPQRWAAVRADPSLVAAVVQETLRHDPPVNVQMMVARADTVIEGQQVPAGAQVAVLLGAANRDPDVFTDADTFHADRDLTPDRPALVPRWPGDLVLPLARTQAVIALAVFVERFPRLSLAGPVLRRPHAPVSRGVLSLPVRTS